MESIVGLSHILGRGLQATWLISVSFQAYTMRKIMEYV